MKRFFLIVIGSLCQFIVVAQWDTEHLMSLGQKSLYKDKEYVLSIQYFNQLISVKPYLFEPYMFRSLAKISLSDYQGAEDDCSKSLEINPFVPYTYYLRAFARANQNKFDEAVKDINKALEFQPNDTSLISYRLAVKEAKKDYKGAIEDVDLLYKIDSKNHKLLYYKGSYLLNLKDTTTAISLFEVYNRLVPESCSGWSALALISLKRNDEKAALEHYNQAIKRKSTYSGDYVNRGNINKNFNNFKQALEDYNSAVKYDSTEVLGYYNRGLLLGYLGDNNNALRDFKKTVQLDSLNYEARWKLAILQLTVEQNYKQAIVNYKIILDKYPYFIPAISGIAEAEEALGNYKKAYTYRQQAKYIDANKDYFKKKANQLTASVKMSDHRSNGTAVKIRTRLLEEPQTAFQDSLVLKYQNENFVNEKDFVVGICFQNRLPRRTNLSRSEIDVVNRLKFIPLCVSNNDIPLSDGLIAICFDNIKLITDSLENRSRSAEKLYCRAILFSQVKDYIGALNDLDKVVETTPNFVLGYFSRANVRHKLFESQSKDTQNSFQFDKSSSKELNLTGFNDDLYRVSIQSIIRDYDKVIELCPDFTFAYFNKANILCSQRDLKTAILLYSKAIDNDSDFAEAYFNRGLTYLLAGEETKGKADLSKSGELGIYEAYSLLQRFKK